MVWIAITLGILMALVAFALMLSLFKGRFILGLTTACAVGLGSFYLSDHYVVPEAELAYLQYHIKKSPIMHTLAAAEPQRFNQYLHDVRVMLYQGGEPSKALIMAHELIHDIFPKYLSHGSNASIAIYIRSTLTLYKQLKKTNPAYVVYAEFPQTIASNHLIPLLRNDHNRYILNRQEAMQLVIRSALHDPHNTDPDGQGEAALTHIIETLVDRYGADAVMKTITTPNDPHLARATEADIIIAFYQDVLKQGEATAGSLMRFIAAAAQEKGRESKLLVS